MAKVKKPKKKEFIGTLTNGKAFSMLYDRSGQTRHVREHYKIVSDKTVGNRRSLMLEILDRKEIEKKKKELLDNILIKVGETESKQFRKLMEDVLSDYLDESLLELHDKVVCKNQEVRATEGCFKLVIGDGRKKKHNEIAIRD